MIYTITCNPAIDLFISSFYEENNKMICGGKGVNVSRTLKTLGTKSKIYGFLSGKTGEMYEKILDLEFSDTNFIKLKNGETRINLKFNIDNEFEINEDGLKVDDYSIETLVNQFVELKENDIIILSGSVSKDTSQKIYQKIISKLKNKCDNLLFIVDASKDLLINTLAEKPFLIKPNKSELEETTGKKLNSIDDIISAAKKLQKMGAENVLVSCGEEGLVFIGSSGEIIIKEAKKVNVISTIGAGDAMVAGFAYGYSISKDINEAINFALDTASSKISKKSYK